MYSIRLVVGSKFVRQSVAGCPPRLPGSSTYHQTLLRRYCPPQISARFFASKDGDELAASSGDATENKIEPTEALDDDDSPLIVSQFKNQIVHQLWTERHMAKKGNAKNSKGLSQDPGKGKTPSQSETKVEYPFTSNELLAESYRSPWNTMRIGRLLEDLDALAGNIAFYHVRQEGATEHTVHPLIVTASVDRIQMRNDHSPTMPADQVLSGRVTFVGTSSMEIRMHCTSVGEEKEWLEAYVTYVTLDPETKKPMHITPLIPETPQEQADFDLGAKKAALKKKRRKQHQQVKEWVQQHAEILLQEARPLLLNMPSLAARDSIQMSATRMQNAMIAQPQVRNLHNRIFGGFLMRRAFELAFANAYVFGGARPIFKEVDEISFAAPVDVGTLCSILQIF